MANDNIALSQEEVDRLLGINNGSAPEQKIEKKDYKLAPFLSEKQFEDLNSVCKSVYKYFKLSLRKKFGEPKIRKLTITSINHQNVDEFFDSVTSNDFVFEAQFKNAKMYIKLDSFLFIALSGMKIDTKHKINLFQTEVLREFVAKYLVEGFARQLKEKISGELLALPESERKKRATGETGVCVAINWNENLHSFGIEKIFLSKELIEAMRAV